MKFNLIYDNTHVWITSTGIHNMSHSSQIFLSDDKNIIMKKILNYLNYDVHKRELYILALLNRVVNWVPKLYSNDDKTGTVLMDFCGDLISNENMPIDFLEQISCILRDLKLLNIQHNDIKLSEILIKNGKIFICDYGWASINNSLGCGQNLYNGPKIGDTYSDDKLIERLIDDKNIDIVFNTDYFLNKTETVVETHLLIDWTMAFDQTIITEKINNKNLQYISTIHRSKIAKKTELLSKFYGCHVDDFRGETDFNIYIIYDTSPVYDQRLTSKGLRKVNIKLFDLKQDLRQITKTHSIHATDNIQETKHNLKTLGLFTDHYKQKQFDNLYDVFTALNKYPQLEWVITHGFEEFKQGDDIDFLTNDYYLFMSILDSTETPKVDAQNGLSNGGYSVRNTIIVNGVNIPIDIRHIGDNFYDNEFQKSILKNRVKYNNEIFFVPCPDEYLHSLIYHSIIHKPEIPNINREILAKLSPEMNIDKTSLKTKLDAYMIEHGYRYVNPEPTVGYFLC